MLPAFTMQPRIKADCCTGDKVPNIGGTHLAWRTLAVMHSAERHSRKKCTTVSGVESHIGQEDFLEPRVTFAIVEFRDDVPHNKRILIPPWGERHKNPPEPRTTRWSAVVVLGSSWIRARFELTIVVNYYASFEVGFVQLHRFPGGSTIP